MFQYIFNSYPFEYLYNLLTKIFYSPQPLITNYAHNEKKKTPNDNLKNFYYLSLIKEPNSESNYTIHGLWPQTDIKNYPTYCKKVNFDMDQLTPILDKLEQYWYSNKHTLIMDEKFWKHEYEKHGSCVYTPMTEFEYFNNTINLYEKALEKNLPSKFYNSQKNQCLIPVDQSLNFIELN
tara:strand:+ start:2377 stop:2913 length:537 start_codon:yes stop_codon:yes gene_type:complete